MTTTTKENYYFAGQHIKSSGDDSRGYIAEVKPETSNMSIMGFGGAAFKAINYKMVIVWLNDHKANGVQLNANEHDILTMKGGDISPDEVNALFTEAKEAKEKANNIEAQKKEAESLKFSQEVTKLLDSPENKHLTPKGTERGAKFTATNVRKQLKKNFPGVKFSVKSDYSSINVRWEDGPTCDSVEGKIKCFDNGHFDGYTDYHYTKSTPFTTAFGGVQYLFINRDHSDNLLQKAIDKAVDGWGDCEHVTVENFRSGRLFRQNIESHQPADWSREINKALNKIDLAPKKAASVQSKKATSDKSDTKGIEKHYHTKKAIDIWLVPMTDRVERAEYLELLAQAKALKGWYSRKWGTTPAGFAFVSLEDAQQFAGDESPVEEQAKPKTKAKTDKYEKLRKIADNMQSLIDNKLGDRLTNTPKRQQEAGRARQEGARLKRTQTVLRKLADLHEAGEISDSLARITSKKAVYDYMSSIIENNGGYYDYGNDTEKPRDTSPESLALWEFVKPKSPEEVAGEKLVKMVQNLQFTKIPGYFPTPSKVIDQMLDIADIQAGERILEPEAGSGAICDAIKARHPNSPLNAYETQYSLREILKLKGVNLVGENFLDSDDWEDYDCIVMNPPFENHQDIDHVLHAYNALKKGGRLVAIMSPSPFFNQNSKAASFRQWFDKYNGHKIDLPSGSFKESGTGVNTILVHIEK